MSATTSSTLYPSQVGSPPKMQVWLYVLLSIVTLFIFPIIWGFRVSSWMRRIDPKSHATTWWAVGVVVLIVFGGFYLLASLSVSNDVQHGTVTEDEVAGRDFLGSLTNISTIFFLISLYSSRSSLNKYFNSVEPIGLKVNGLLLFFVQEPYLQYKLNEVARRGSTIPTPAAVPFAPAAQAAPPYPAAGTLCLQVAGTRHQLLLGGTLTAAQIPGLTSISASGIVARISAHPVLPDAMGLNNQSQQTWHVTLPGGEAAQIASGQTIRLTQGAQFWFGQIAGVVV